MSCVRRAEIIFFIGLWLILMMVVLSWPSIQKERCYDINQSKSRDSTISYEFSRTITMLGG